MKGLELGRKYYEECGKPMLESEFSDVLKYLAIGYVGSGSDRFGFDDEISTDHDFEPGFCIFLPGEDIIDSKIEFKLERAYAKLPKEFTGYTRQAMSPVGGNRNGVMRTADFYKEHAGSPTGDLDLLDWCLCPSNSLAEATNGEVFFDGYGEFTAIREKLMNMPEDARLKRLAGNVLLMAQSGQYNYPRCIKHGEVEAAQLTSFEFVHACLNSIFLIEGKYMPYYKWSFRGLKDMGYSDLAAKLYAIISTDNSHAEDKYYAIEGIASDVIDMLQERSLTKATCGDLEKHAYSINDLIKDNNIRNANVLMAAGDR